MDRRVKERLVGASILAALIVLIVPELLSGPPGPTRAPAGPRLPVSTPEPVRNVTVDLATSKAPEPEQAAAEPAASSAQPSEARGAEAASAAAGADASAGANAALPADTPPADTQPAAAQPTAAQPRTASVSLETAARAPMSIPAAKPAVAGRAWAVQLGSFASRANADKLARQLKAQGFAVYVVSGGSRSSLRYRVRIGPLADRGAATQAVAKLKSAGQAASLVSPAP